VTEPIKCKRIIDGKSYNTETANLVAFHEEQGGPDIERYLFKTRYGAFFEYIFLGDIPSEHIKPMSEVEAQQWMEKYASVEAYAAEFGERLEAGNTEARITLRMPETLRQQASKRAAEYGQSLNTWIMRQIESGLISQRSKP
jgi:predicted HicB family RNase H-like nuclease